MPLFHRFVGRTLDAFLSFSTQERLGRFMVRRSRGEDDDDAHVNGEYALLERVAKKTSSPAVLFDVGANKGDWVMHASGKFAPGTRVFAFEPVAATHEYLKSRLSSLAKPELAAAAHLALGDTNGRLEMNVSGQLSGSNSLYQRQGSGVRGERVEAVQIQRGDDFCREHQIQKITLLKIDTEGHEMAVLRGFSELLARQAIEILQFEYGGTWIDARTYLKDAFALLGAHGYKMGRLMPDRVKWFSTYHQDLESFRYSNWVAALSETRC